MTHSAAPPSRTPSDTLSWPRAAAWLVGLLLVVIAVVLGVGWLLTHPLADSLGGQENDFSRWVARHRTSTLNSVSDAGTFLGQTLIGLVVLGVAGLVVAVWQRSFRPLVFVAVGYGALGVIYFLGTTLDPRRRPPVKILQTGLDPNASFPSGHTATATAIALGVILLARAYAGAHWRWSLVLLVLPVLTLLSRLYAGAHHVTDVLTAMVYAGFWLVASARLLLPRVSDTR
ncbi:MAG: phosphatase PAP2 family protein [Nocardioides sp.]